VSVGEYRELETGAFPDAEVYERIVKVFGWPRGRALMPSAKSEPYGRAGGEQGAVAREHHPERVSAGPRTLEQRLVGSILHAIPVTIPQGSHADRTS
jgi:hypothetical protein